MDGILIIDKPAGITSHDVVGKTRKILKTKRVGHTGTLDPFATGVMVLLIGKATRLAQFLDKDAKEYEAVVRFGFETETGDLTGAVKNSDPESKSPTSISEAEIEKILPEFRGEIRQTPPMYSAKKIAGKKLYELARQGIEIERKPVAVTIYESELLESIDSSASKPEVFDLKATDHRPPTTDYCLRVLCSAGTYIRTLAEDIGRKLGTGAHLAALRRTKAGKFELAQAVTLEKLAEIFSEGNLSGVLISMNAAVSHLAEFKLDEKNLAKIKNGLRIFTDGEFAENQIVRLTDAQENLAAIAVYDNSDQSLRPRLVLAD